ncbi:hypothetical protein CHLNCDRAFT_133681 [Chlorella variabilis]|uniref:F-box domain-containing protein n=1 Tax=Chlorella variabilis TaxID=554065 RepID=E1Z3K2_CHLVA|nr:hypothetical protein CHLNCDRAFT_133681 [Chlorella variabilis]EFN60176.1 hypothetical protein CHLNCDRAFT_133681 [Chlorella variabilis]|eukprot:XP_005852278.1 hypothetical protein CHLNCDRAFT_133681 [Chlorella variabilis]
MRQLEDLDDPLLLHCFSFLTPLPDLFNVAASCRRFRDLALDRRSWLFVTHAAAAAAAAPRRAERAPAPALPPWAASNASLGSPAAAAEAAAAAAAAAGDGTPHWYRSQFATLDAAVAASRPGDTILLEAGPAPHAVSAPLAVPHPVLILGGGVEAGECVLQGSPGLDALLDFRQAGPWQRAAAPGANLRACAQAGRASGRLANLTLRATSGACVAHTRGRLTVQGCNLECDARGLPHLVAPLLTRAASWPRIPPTPAVGAAAALPHPAAPGPALAAATGAAAQRGASKRAAAGDGDCATGTGGGAAAEEPPAAKRLRAWRDTASAAAGPGVLSVAESRIKAVGCAVELRGSGRLSAVRAIYNSSHTLIWLEVDSADFPPDFPAGGRHVSAASRAPAANAGDAPASDAAAAAAGSSSGGGGGGGLGAAGWAPGPAAHPATPLPSWAVRAAAAGFDAAAFQRRAQRLAAAAAAPAADAQPRRGAAGEQPAGAAGMELKAEEWCVRHHAAMSPPPKP